LFGTLKVQSCMLTEVRDYDLLIVVTSKVIKVIIIIKNSTHCCHVIWQGNQLSQTWRIAVAARVKLLVIGCLILCLILPEPLPWTSNSPIQVASSATE